MTEPTPEDLLAMREMILNTPPAKHILVPGGEFFYDEVRKVYFTADGRQLTEDDLG